MTAQTAMLDGQRPAEEPGWWKRQFQKLGRGVASLFTFSAFKGFVLNGGTAVVNLGIAFWLVKYLWAWKMLSFMPTIGAGPTAEGGSVKWVLYVCLGVITANVLNLAFADFRTKPTAWIHMSTNGIMFGVAFVAILDYYVRKSTALTGLTDVQQHVMHSFVWTGALTSITGLIALRLNRLYFGDLTGQHR